MRGEHVEPLTVEKQHVETDMETDRQIDRSPSTALTCHPPPSSCCLSTAEPPRATKKVRSHISSLLFPFVVLFGIVLLSATRLLLFEEHLVFMGIHKQELSCEEHEDILRVTF